MIALTQISGRVVIFFFHLMIWGISHAFIYGFIVTQACFLPWYSDSFLERSLTRSGLPKFLGFPSLSTVPYRDFYRCLYMCWLFSRVWLFATPWTVAHQAALSVDFSRQEYWSGLPFPSPGDLSHPGIEPRSPSRQADFLSAEPQGKLTEVRAGQQKRLSTEELMPSKCGAGEDSWEPLGQKGD